ncbi:MAG TPA: ribonuclease D [Acidiferrobacter sp.]|nr:ribonuclease D [Acidiferrobacter sp.]
MTELLTDQGALKTLCDAIATAPWVGLDTEFVRERTYFAQLCLIQVALPDALVLVDPLHLDIRPLGAALSARGIKIFHAGRQDLELLLQETNELPAPLFDTQIAAALVGQNEQIGYAKLVAHFLQVELNKDATRTNWALRPLSARQLAYAQDDVRYLETLYDKLLAELSRLDRTAWLREDCAALTDPEIYRFSADQLTRRYRQGANLSAAGQAIFQDLLVWRESAAKEADLPRTWVLPDAALVDLAARPPRTLGDFADRHGFDAQTIQRFAEALLATVEGAAQTPRYAWAQPILKPEEDRLYSALVTLVEARAQALAIMPGVICSRRALKEIAQGAAPANLAHGWRAEILGSKGARLLTDIADLHA